MAESNGALADVGTVLACSHSFLPELCAIAAWILVGSQKSASQHLHDLAFFTLFWLYEWIFWTCLYSPVYMATLNNLSNIFAKSAKSDFPNQHKNSSGGAPMAQTCCAIWTSSSFWDSEKLLGWVELLPSKTCNVDGGNPRSTKVNKVFKFLLGWPKIIPSTFENGWQIRFHDRCFLPEAKLPDVTSPHDEQVCSEETAQAKAEPEDQDYYGNMASKWPKCRRFVDHSFSCPCAAANIP